MFCDPITDALGLIPAVDLAATYALLMGGHDVAAHSGDVASLGHHHGANLTEAVAATAFGFGPDIVHVVGEMTLSATYRPTVSPLRGRRGFPRGA